MKNRSYAILLGVGLSLASASLSHGMSHLVGFSMEPQWPETTSPGTTIAYKLDAIVREGQGLLEVTFSSEGLPAGTQVTFTPAKVRFTGRVPTVQTAYMIITCPEVMPTDIYPFTVTATARRESITLTNQVALGRDANASLRPLLMLEPLADGGLRIRGLGAGGQTYRIESTGDLTNPVWAPLGSTTADGNGRFSFFIPADQKQAPIQFYRAVAIPAETGPAAEN